MKTLKDKLRIGILRDVNKHEDKQEFIFKQDDVKEAVLDYIKYSRIDGAKDRNYAFETLNYLETKYGELPKSDEHAIELIFGFTSN